MAGPRGAPEPRQFAAGFPCLRQPAPPSAVLKRRGRRIPPPNYDTVLTSLVPHSTWRGDVGTCCAKNPGKDLKIRRCTVPKAIRGLSESNQQRTTNSLGSAQTPRQQRDILASLETHGMTSFGCKQEEREDRSRSERSAQWYNETQYQNMQYTDKTSIRR